MHVDVEWGVKEDEYLRTNDDGWNQLQPHLQSDLSGLFP